MAYKDKAMKKAYDNAYYKNWYAKNGRKLSDKSKAIIKEWENLYPEKVKAKKLVRKAVANGSLVRPRSCEKCGRVTVIHGHHEDYSKPLSVWWLCASCHRFRHVELKSNIT